MRVLLVNPLLPRQFTDKYYPLGLGYLASSLIGAGFDVGVEDLNVGDSGKLLVQDYDAVCVTATTPQVNQAYKVLNYVKSINPSVYTVMGGVHASALPERTIKECPGIDCLVIGEGEETLPKAIEERPRGIVRARPVENLDTLPFPNRSLFPLEQYTQPRTQTYTKERRYAPIITSRGCPFSCYYCWNSKQDKRVRVRSPENVMGELEEVRSLGINEVQIEDDQFTIDVRRCMDICRVLANLGFSWSLPNGIHINTVNEDLLRFMKKCGLHHVSYGIESGNQDVLDGIGKGEKLEHVRNAVRETKRVGIKVTLLFMIGLRHDTAKTMQDTIDLAKSLNPDNATFGICTPYPSSTMYDWVYFPNDSNWDSYIHSDQSDLEWEHPDFPSRELCKEFSRKAYREFYLRPTYLLRHIKDFNPARFKALIGEVK